MPDNYLTTGARLLSRMLLTLLLIGSGLRAAPLTPDGPVNPVNPALSLRPLAAVSYSVQADPFPVLASANRRVFFDADSDGDIDMLYQTSTTNTNDIALKLNDGSGGFATTHSATNGTGTFSTGPLTGISFTSISTSVYSLDYDNDGDADLYEGVAGATGRIIRNNGGNYSVQADPFPVLASALRRVFFDADNDGDIDMLYQTSITNTNDIALKLNDGSGGFATTHSATNGTGTFSTGPLTGISFTSIPTSTLYTLDYDDDGDTDLYKAEAGAAGQLIRNNGGSFSVQADPFPVLASALRRVFFDADSDGDIDMLYQTSTTNTNDIALKLNDGSGGFATTHSATNGTGTFSTGPLTGISFTSIPTSTLYTLDYDDDGDTDLYKAEAGAAGQLIEQNDTPPILSSTVPADNATNVSPATNLTLVFNRSVSKGTGNLYIVRVSDNVVVETVAVGSSQVTGSGTTWVLDPSITLANSTAYALRADEEVFADADGRAFAGIFNNTTFNFTTGIANAPPTDIALTATTVAENQASGTAVGTLSTTDANAGQTFSYSLVTGAGSTDNASFQIVGSQLNTAAVFNFETKSSYLIRIRTTDSGSPALSFEESFTITVTNVNETPTISPQTFAVNENAANGTVVGTVVASDPDAGATLSYSILSGNTGGAFTFASNSLQVANTTALDFETTPTFSLSVRVSDGTLSATALVTVNLNNLVEGGLSISPAAPAAVCAGSPLNLTATTTGFTPTNYTWSSLPAGFAASGASLTAFTQNAPAVNVPTTYTVTASATDGTTTAGASVTVLVNATPTLTVVGTGANLTACGASDGSIAFTSTNLPDGVYSLTYTGSGSPKPVTVSSNAFSLTGLSAGTYSNFSISNSGCIGSVTASRTLSDPAQPIAIVGADQGICTGSSAALSATATNGTGVWSVFSGPSTAADQFNNTALATATFTPVGGAGTYTLRWTVSSGACTPATDDVVITVAALPTLTAGIGTNPSSCSGANGSIAFTTNLPDGPYSLTYTGTSSPKAVTVSNGTFNLTGLVAGIYSNFSISNGCVGSTSASVTLSDPAAPSLTVGNSVNPTTCGGANGSIAFTTTNLPDGPYSLTYTGTGSPQTITVSGGAFTLTGLAAGTYSNFIISNNGCTGLANTSRILMDPAVPILTLGAITSPTTCGGSEGSIAFSTVNLPDGPYSLTYIGTGSPQTITVTDNAFSLTGLSAGTYSNFTITNNGCTGSVATPTTLNGPLQPTLTVGSATNPTTCGASNGSIAFTVTNLPDGPYSLTYTGAGSPRTVTVLGGAFSLTGLAAGSYSNFTIGNNGCIGSAATSRLLSDPAQPIANVGTNQTLCTGATATLSATATNGTGAWSVVSGPSLDAAQFSNSASASATFTPGGGAGVYTLRWTVTSGNCTPATAEVTISVNLQPTITLRTNANPTTCGGNTGSINFTTNLPDGPYSLTYTGAGSPKTVTVGGGSFTLTGLTAGSYSNFSLNNGGCTVSVATPVTLNDPVAPTLTVGSAVDPTTCGGNNGSIAFTTTNLPDGPYSLSYTGAGSPRIITISGGLFSLTNLSSGTYANFAISSNGCIGAAATSRTLADPTAPTLALGTLTNPTACGGNTGSISFTTSLTDGTYSFTYTGAGSPKTIVVSGGAFSLTGLSAGTYSNFSVSANGCVGSASASVTLNDPAAPTLAVSGFTDPTSCLGSNGTITFTTTNLVDGVYSLTYTGAGSPKNVTVSGGTFTLTGLSAGSYSAFSLTSNGCTGSVATSVPLSDPAAPVATLVNNGPFSCTTVSITLTASGGVSYAFGTGATQIGGSAGSTATVNSPGTYSVIVTAASGCTATASTTVAGSNDVPPAPNLTSRTVTQNSGDVTLTTTNCLGTLNWTGPNGTAGTGSIVVPTGNAGSFIYSATCVVGLCSSAPTSVTVTVTPAGNQPLQLVTPLYNCRTGSLTFQTVGGNGSLIEYMAIGVTGWSSNPTHIVEAELRADANSSGVLNLMARQNGNVVRLNFDFRAFCAGSNGNQPPQVMMPIATQNATQGSPFSFAIPAGTFSDPENQALTLTLQGLPTGLSFLGGNTISGTPTQSGNFPLLLTATDPGGLSANTTFQLIIAPSGAVQPLTLIEPLYNCQTGAITFRTSGGNGSLIEYMAIGVTGWSPNPSQTVDAALRQDLNSSSVLTLMARQNGVVVSLAFNFRAFCQGVPVNNLPPIFHGPVASQLGTQGQPFSYQIPQAAFSDPENGALTFSATGLPPGLNFTGASRTISGTPTQPGSYTVTITAADSQNATASGSLVITIQSSGTGPSPLQLVTPLYNCQTGQLTFQTTGGNGSTIEFMAVGVTAWTTNPQQTVDAPLRQDLNSSSVLNLMARQNGVVVSLAFDFRAFCSQGARPAAPVDAERQPLQVTVLGNPVLNEVLDVAIRGAQGQSVRLALTDMNGHTVAEKQVDSAATVERQTIRVGRSVGGLLLLRVSTATQQQVVKILVP